MLFISNYCSEIAPAFTKFLAGYYLALALSVSHRLWPREIDNKSGSSI